ncbi:hypothetical protein DSCA_53950 [Desulfosarcina alkanivorans]|uniref:Uncharacterized protein n=1 Tax=Desulfosarcina alkanivorans TaxID=571177 RepID=A0A5K7YSU2_9BACT|nr:hypothetical protein [Desulfosarcina alkanivorans]BBO71465.1 hypothetical protein DSCA_53950 [Desulfosarcina alkanivorans]
MDPTHPDYHFMRDQYLELLWAAQRVEDRRLTELILRRLKDTALEMTVAPEPACEIIPFPSIIVHPVGCADGYDDVRLLWPRQPLRHLLSMVCGYCGVVLFFGFFGLTH